MPTRSPCNVEQLCLLPRLDPTVRSPKNLERSWTLSLSNLFFPSTAGSSPKKREDVLFSFHLFLFCPLTYHMSSHHWLAWIPYPLIPLLWDFPLMSSCHVSTHDPYLSSCLTNSTHDTCDTPNPGGSWTIRQPAENLWMSGNPTPLH